MPLKRKKANSRPPQFSIFDHFGGGSFAESAINEYAQGLWNARHAYDAENTRFYHYTDIEGLTGILARRAFRFGDASSFNDPDEIRHGMEIIGRVLERYIEDSEEAVVRAALNQAKLFISGFESLYHVFAVCFCESGDLLSQWRGYADRGGGFSLGLSFPQALKMKVDRESVQDESTVFVRKIIYENTDKFELVQGFIDRLIDGIRKDLKRQNLDFEHYASDVGISASNQLIDMATCFKLPGFREEKEWRIVHVTRSDYEAGAIEFKNVAGRLKPYRSTLLYTDDGKVLKFPIATIAVGPSVPHFEQAKNAIRMLLNKVREEKHGNIVIDSHSVEILGVDYRLRP